MKGQQCQQLIRTTCSMSLDGASRCRRKLGHICTPAVNENSTSRPRFWWIGCLDWGAFWLIAALEGPSCTHQDSAGRLCLPAKIRASDKSLIAFWRCATFCTRRRWGCCRLLIFFLLAFCKFAWHLISTPQKCLFWSVLHSWQLRNENKLSTCSLHWLRKWGWNSDFFRIYSREYIF